MYNDYYRDTYLHCNASSLYYNSIIIRISVRCTKNNVDIYMQYRIL